MPESKGVSPVFAKLLEDSAVHTERDRALAEAIVELGKKLDNMSTRIASLEAMGNRWKGGMFVVLGLGGIFTFFVTVWDRVKAALH